MPCREIPVRHGRDTIPVKTIEEIGVRTESSRHEDIVTGSFDTEKKDGTS